MIKISVITDLSILKFYGYIGNICEYFDKNIGKVKINKNKFMKILCRYLNFMDILEIFVNILTKILVKRKLTKIN